MWAGGWDLGLDVRFGFSIAVTLWFNSDSSSSGDNGLLWGGRGDVRISSHDYLIGPGGNSALGLIVEDAGARNGVQDRVGCLRLQVGRTSKGLIDVTIPNHGGANRIGWRDSDGEEIVRSDAIALVVILTDFSQGFGGKRRLIAGMGDDAMKGWMRGSNARILEDGRGSSGRENEDVGISRNRVCRLLCFEQSEEGLDVLKHLLGHGMFGTKDSASLVFWLGEQLAVCLLGDFRCKDWGKDGDVSSVGLPV